MKICFIHDWTPDIEQALTWNDGLCAALRHLNDNGHTVHYFSFTKNNEVFTVKNNGLEMTFIPEENSMERLKEIVKDFKPDALLHWADMSRGHASIGKDMGIPQAICFAGGNPFGETWHFFDHIFTESNSYLFQFQRRGLGDIVSIAFGTNEKLFTPIENQRKNIDVIFPGTFCDWKRHNLLVDSLKDSDLSVLCCGYIYEDHETHCWQAPQRAGFIVLPHVSATTLRHLFAASRVCVIPSHWTGGSQRTVLEAMAMNVPLVVMSDSDKTSEYVMDAGIGKVVPPDPQAIREAVAETLEEGPINSREYILSKWTSKHYADNLEKGLLKICN